MGINIPKANQEQIQTKGITIPPPTGGLSAVGLFGKLASGFINALAISNLGNSESNDNVIIDESVGNLVNSDANIFTFQPDAIPDGKGGYKQSQSAFWNGRRSAITSLPVMTSLRFEGTTYTKLNGQTVTIPTITFEMIMISIKRGKNIEKTDITGRDTGSVKEYISAKDFEVELRVVVMASQPVTEHQEAYYSTGKYPEENMEILDLLFDAPIAIKITCLYLNKRGINYLVIDDGVSFAQIEGKYEMQEITIPCLSDNPLVLQVNS